jgi:hypothetical protein
MAPLGRTRDHEQHLQRLRDFKGPSLHGILLIAGGAIAALWVGWRILETNFYRNAIPAEIGLTWDLATTGSDSSLITALLPIPPKACGGAIFGLAAAAAEAVKHGGLTFLSGARQGRGYQQTYDRQYAYYTYAPWQQTPLPDGWLAEVLNGQWYGLSCMRLSSRYAESIAKAAGHPGSFYTTGSSKMLLVIPELALVVYTYTH